MPGGGNLDLSLNPLDARKARNAPRKRPSGAPESGQEPALISPNPAVPLPAGLAQQGKGQPLTAAQLQAYHAFHPPDTNKATLPPPPVPRGKQAVHSVTQQVDWTTPTATTSAAPTPLPPVRGVSNSGAASLRRAQDARPPQAASVSSPGYPGPSPAVQYGSAAQPIVLYPPSNAPVPSAEPSFGSGLVHENSEKTLRAKGFPDPSRPPLYEGSNPLAAAAAAFAQGYRTHEPTPDPSGLPRTLPPLAPPGVGPAFRKRRHSADGTEQPALMTQFEHIVGHMYDPVVDLVKLGRGEHITPLQGGQCVTTGAPSPQVSAAACDVLAAAQAHMLPGGKSIARKSLLLKVPVVTADFTLDLPAAVTDSAGHQCLIILPSDKPSTRHEALALESLLAQILRDPATAVQRAAYWRAHALQTLCGDAIAALNEGLFGGRLGPRPLGQAWVFAATIGSNDSVSSPERRGKAASARPGKADNLVRLLQDDISQVTSQEIPAVRSSPTMDSSPDRQNAVSGATPTQDSVHTALSIAVATTICMADAIRQVEIQCGERGRVLTYIWNAYMTTHENVMRTLREDNNSLKARNKELADQNLDLASQVEAVEYLRKEIIRFRKHASSTDEESTNILRDNIYYQNIAEESVRVLKAVEAVVNKQLACLRWQHAFHVLGSRTKQLTVVSGNLGRADDPNTLVNKVLMLDKLRGAVIAAKRRKMAHGLTRKAEEYQTQTFTEVVKAALHQTHHNQWAAGIDEAPPDMILEYLSGLQPDAQVVVLAALPEVKRTSVLQLMPVAQRAQLLVLMSDDMRQWTRDVIGQKEWRAMMLYIQDDPMLAAKLLGVVEMYEAVLEFSNYSTEKQMQVLACLDQLGDRETAGQLLRRIPINMRKDLLSRLDPSLAARCIQGLEPAGYISDVLDGVAELAQVAILSKMAPDRAAAVLVLAGTDKAAEHLVYMDDEAARTAILEQLPPKFAAATLVIMDEIASELRAQRRKLERQLAEDQGAAALAAYEEALAKEAQARKALEDATNATTPGSADPGADATTETDADTSSVKMAGQALLAMEQQAASNILGHMDFRDKADLLSQLDTNGVSNLMTKMDPSDALALLSIMSDTSMRALAESLTEDDKAKLLKALGGVPAAKGKGKGKTTGKAGSGKISINHAKKEQVHEAYESEFDKLVAGVDNDSVAGSARGSLSGLAGDFPGQPSMADLHLRESLRRHSLSGADRRGSATGDAPDSPPLRATARSSMPGGMLGTPQGRELNRVRSNLARMSYAGHEGSHSSPRFKSGFDDILSENEFEGDDYGLHDGLAGGGGGGGGGRGGGGRRRGGKSGLGPGRMGLSVDVGDDGAWEEGEGDGLEDGEGGGGGNETPGGGGGGEYDSVASTPKTPSTRSGRGGATPRGGRGGRGGPRQSVMGRSSAANEKVAISLDGDDKKKTMKALRNGMKGSAEGQAAIKAAKARLDASAAAEDAWDMAMEDQTDAGGGGEQQGKLGKLPKNQRLKDAMAQHRNAKPKPKGWLITVVEQVYKDAELIIKKLGRLEALRKQSVPEVVFAYFHNKYGQKNVVNEYVGSLVNTLTLYKPTDLRLEAFAKFLSEEWDFSTFLDFLTAQSMLLQPAKLVCIDYARDATRDEPYPWSCLYKCVYVSDTLIGNRSKAVRDKFNEFVQEAATQVEDSEVDKVRKDKRFEGEVIPDRFYKLPRPKFLLLLCKELQRLNSFIAKLADDKFNRIDVQRAGQIGVPAVPGYLGQMLPPNTPQPTIDEVQQTFLQFACAMDKDIPATEVVMDDVKTVSRDAFVQASIQSAAIREYVKMALLPPPRPDDDADEAEMFKTYLVSVVLRHVHHMVPHYRKWLSADGKDVLVAEQVMAVGKERVGDAKFKAYLNLLAAILNIEVSSIMEALQDCMDFEEISPAEIEQSLSRVEDVVCILLHKEKYLLACEPDLQVSRMKRLPISLRTQNLAEVNKSQTHYKNAQLANAGYVFQSQWRKRQKVLGLAAPAPAAAAAGPRSVQPSSSGAATEVPVSADAPVTVEAHVPLDASVAEPTLAPEPVAVVSEEPAA